MSNKHLPRRNIINSKQFSEQSHPFFDEIREMFETGIVHGKSYRHHNIADNIADRNGQYWTDVNRLSVGGV